MPVRRIFYRLILISSQRVRVRNTYKPRQPQTSQRRSWDIRSAHQYCCGWTGLCREDIFHQQLPGALPASKSRVRLHRPRIRSWTRRQPRNNPTGPSVPRQPYAKYLVVGYAGNWGKWRWVVEFEVLLNLQLGLIRSHHPPSFRFLRPGTFGIANLRPLSPTCWAVQVEPES